MTASKPRKLHRDLWMIGLPSLLLVVAAFALMLLLMRPARKRIAIGADKGGTAG